MAAVTAGKGERKKKEEKQKKEIDKITSCIKSAVEREAGRGSFVNNLQSLSSHSQDFFHHHFHIYLLSASASCCGGVVFVLSSL